MSTEGLKEADQRFMLAVISMKGTLSAEEREQIAVVTGSTENAVRYVAISYLQCLPCCVDHLLDLVHKVEMRINFSYLLHLIFLTNFVISSSTTNFKIRHFCTSQVYQTRHTNIIPIPTSTTAMPAQSWSADKERELLLRLIDFENNGLTLADWTKMVDDMDLALTGATLR